MKAKYFGGQNEISIREIEEVAQGILQGKSAIFPTETVYGISTNALDDKACKEIYKMKQRPEDKSLIVLISDMAMLEDIVESVNSIEKKLMEQFWPGPLTIIFRKGEKSKIAQTATGGKESIAIRMTNGEIARLLIKKAGVPIVAPSANISGEPTGTKIKNIIEQLGGSVDYILDCGDIQNDTTSTIVKVEDDVICILRQGKITKEELQKIAKVKAL